MSTLSVIGTPIGNLGDITLRALEVLRSVDLILCEDTRTTKNLLTKHGIGTKTMSYHMHSKISRVEEIIGLLKEGKNIALVSDAGTPGISDPGAELVAKVRKEIDNDCLKDFCDGRGDMPHTVARGDFCGAKIKIEAIPGPSAFVAALSIAGVACADFTFLGFLPHKKGRETLFKEIAASERTMIFYESPHRIMKTLESLVEHLEVRTVLSTSRGREQPRDFADTFPRDLAARKVTVCKELTKVFEEVISGTATEVKTYFESNPDKIRGEFVVIVSN